MKIETGSIIPSFKLPDQYGDLFDSESVVGKKKLVIYFYPKNETAGCTKEACMFRDHYEEFKDAGAEVIGISSDPVDSHRSFGARLELPFILLSDDKGRVRKQFGVPGSLFGLLPGRVTYVVDDKGLVQYVFNSQTNIHKHIQKSLELITTL